MRLVKGVDLSDDMRRQVWAAFVYRHHAIGTCKYYATEQDWLVDHAFWFTKGNRLALNRKYCEPAFMAEDTNGAQD